MYQLIHPTSTRITLSSLRWSHHNSVNDISALQSSCLASNHLLFYFNFLLLFLNSWPNTLICNSIFTSHNLTAVFDLVQESANGSLRCFCHQFYPTSLPNTASSQHKSQCLHHMVCSHSPLPQAFHSSHLYQLFFYPHDKIPHSKII